MGPVRAERAVAEEGYRSKESIKNGSSGMFTLLNFPLDLRA